MKKGHFKFAKKGTFLNCLDKKRKISLTDLHKRDIIQDRERRNRRDEKQ